jgi:hypothetical protein
MRCRQNDLLSYCKEEAEGVQHNIVLICRRSGMGAQEAFDYIGDLLEVCYRDWHISLSELSPPGEALDVKVQNYIDAIQRSIIANANWSFHTQRYLGEARHEIRKSRIISVLAELPDMETEDA